MWLHCRYQRDTSSVSRKTKRETSRFTFSAFNKHRRPVKSSCKFAQRSWLLFSPNWSNLRKLSFKPCCYSRLFYSNQLPTSNSNFIETPAPWLTHKQHSCCIHIYQPIKKSVIRTAVVIRQPHYKQLNNVKEMGTQGANKNQEFYWQKHINNHPVFWHTDRKIWLHEEKTSIITWKMVIKQTVHVLVLFSTSGDFSDHY